MAGRFTVVEDRERASESEQGKLLYSEQRRTDGKKGDRATTSNDGQERCRRPRDGKKTKPKGYRAGGMADPAVDAEQVMMTPATTATAPGTGLRIAPSHGEIAVRHTSQRETLTPASSSRMASLSSTSHAPVSH
jgi:hypothetical protein